MSSWEQFVGSGLPCGSPLRLPSCSLPAVQQKGIENRAALSLDSVTKYRHEQLSRIRRAAAADGPSASPRWGLLQRLGELAGHPDKTLAVDAGNGGFKVLKNDPPSATAAYKAFSKGLQELGMDVSGYRESLVRPEKRPYKPKLSSTTSPCTKRPRRATPTVLPTSSQEPPANPYARAPPPPVGGLQASSRPTQPGQVRKMLPRF